ncbi:Tripartite tricarboxylate transporter TctB family protein [Modicisalibacter muralis]|uniref:Tripartite tricarboxylate transporter TctB family protein n=1 Tax=Modicisalibacter muralis TaxID=119000 RepID=A0A1G9RR81_9GAMM|nr:tripartite tricarboxylate transporter TctB family protein [Halomonas muralis]SDM25721.1 Tripartite tricarboxylate transporter TctB family protein [Halomonas muralis]
MRQASIELGVASLGAGLSLIGVVYAMEFPRDSAYLPTAVLSLLTLLLVMWATKAFVLVRQQRTEPLQFQKGEVRRFVVLVIASIALIAISPWLGFTTSFLIFVPLTGFLLGYRKWKWLVLTGVVFTALIYLVFIVLLSRPLPAELLMRLL